MVGIYPAKLDPAEINLRQVGLLHLLYWDFQCVYGIQGSKFQLAKVIINLSIYNNRYWSGRPVHFRHAKVPGHLPGQDKEVVRKPVQVFDDDVGNFDLFT